MADENPFYIGIYKPNEVRRELLQCSKSVILCLKRFERLRVLRENKSITTNEFRNKVREINFLIDKLNRCLPKSDVANLPVRKIAEYPAAGGKESQQETRYEELSEIERLEKDLERIESRLNSLN